MEKIISEINSRVKSVMDPQWWASVQIFKVLSDEQPHQFNEIRVVTSLSGVTVSKHLKSLIKAGIVKRHVDASTFPPKSVYKVAGGQHSKFFVSIAKELCALDKVADDIIATALQARQPSEQRQALEKLEETLTWLRQETIAWIWEGALLFNSESLPELGQQVYAAARAYSLLLLYFTMAEAVKISPIIEKCVVKMYPELAQKLATFKEKCKV